MFVLLKTLNVARKANISINIYYMAMAQAGDALNKKEAVQLLATASYNFKQLSLLDRLCRTCSCA